MLAEVAAPEQELAGERLRAAQVAVGLHPHPADRFPTSFGDALTNFVEQLRVILADGLVQMGLALGEVIFGELLHQTQDGVKRAGSFAAGLVEGPQPGHVDVGVAGGGERDVQRRAAAGNGTVQSRQRGDDAVVKALPERFAGVENLEGVVEGVEQPNPDGIVAIKDFGRSQGDARADDEIAGRLVDLDDCAGAHDGAGDGTGVPVVAQACPALQDQLVRLAVGPLRAQQNLLVVAVTGGERNAVHVDQRFGVAEVPRIAQGQVEGDGLVGVPIGGNLETAAQGEFGEWSAPVGVGDDF